MIRPAQLTRLINNQTDTLNACFAALHTTDLTTEEREILTLLRTNARHALAQLVAHLKLLRAQTASLQ